MTKERQDRGAVAEAIVASRLQNAGFELHGRNVRVGRLELDIIAQRGSLLVFCEVRSRSNDRCGEPWETIGRSKLGKVRRAAGRWLRESRQAGRIRNVRAVRIDVASVMFEIAGPRISYYADVTAWT